MTVGEGERPKRRHVLLGATGIIGSLAGCQEIFASDESEDRITQPRPCRMSIENWDSKFHTVYVMVERGDKIVHWSEHEIPAGDPSRDYSEQVSYELPQFKNKAGRYVVSASYDNRREWGRQDLTKIEAHSKCVGGLIRILPSGKVAVTALL